VVSVRLVSEHRKDYFLSVVRKRKIFTMLPRRRGMQTPDRLEEREIPRRRGRQMPDPVMAREIHDLCTRLEYMEIAQRCIVDIGDLSDSESEIEVEHEEEVTTNELLIRVISRMGAREKMDIPVYEGNLDAEELLDWIRALDTYFDYEDVEEDKKDQA
jgi:hypothetical protein